MCWKNHSRQFPQGLTSTSVQQSLQTPLYPVKSTKAALTSMAFTRWDKRQTKWNIFPLTTRFIVKEFPFFALRRWRVSEGLMLKCFKWWASWWVVTEYGHRYEFFLLSRFFWMGKGMVHIEENFEKFNLTTSHLNFVFNSNIHFRRSLALKRNPPSTHSYFFVYR